jgi:cytoskeletal protein CcmA (bactofilin family)
MFKKTTKLTAHKNIKYSNEIGAGSSILGNLEGAGNYKISGGLLGNISEVASSGATLVINQEGYVQGDIHYSNLIVIGTVDGSIDVSGRIEVYPCAVIRGDIKYKQLIIHPDAKVNGRITCSNLQDKDHDLAEVIILSTASKTGTYTNN